MFVIYDDISSDIVIINGNIISLYIKVFFILIVYFLLDNKLVKFLKVKWFIFLLFLIKKVDFKLIIKGIMVKVNNIMIVGSSIEKGF